MGLRGLVIGLGLFGFSWVLGGMGPMGAAAKGLHMPAWWAVIIGVALIVIDGVLVRVKAAEAPQAPPAPDARSRSTPRESVEAAPSNQWGRTDAPVPLPSKPTLVAVKAETVPFKEARWGPSVFAAIEWRRFEAVVETLFTQAGFSTRSQSHGADGGVDIWLYSNNAEGPVSVVQCKHWQGKPVTVKEMREFLGVMVSKGVKRGTYATTSRYTADALEFAKAHGINAQDGNGLLKLIAQRSPEQQAQLLDVAYEGEYWKPTCASCGVKMTERLSSKDGSRFWGCVNYPRCRRTLAIKAG
jgi:restriction system protein